MMSKEQEQEINRHKHNTRNQTKQGMYTGPFFKRKRKEVFSAIDIKQGHLGPVSPKERKEVLIL